jgi:uncharacterized membrane protein YdfJ with MMPL/SSD domain
MRLLNRLNRHPRIVLVVWATVVAVALPFATHQSDHLTLGGYEVPGSQSARVNATLGLDFPRISRANLAVLLWPRPGATSAAINVDIHRVEVALHHLSGVELTKQASEQARFAAGLVGPIIIPLQVTATEYRAPDSVQQLRTRLRIGDGTPGHVEVHLLGESALAAAVAQASRQQLAKAERIGLPVLLIVLLLIFGSLVAAALPLVLAAVALIVSGALIYFLSLATELSVFSVTTASMFGIGVAVDYSLIILARVRQELQAGRDLPQARAIARATAGRAVVFSGLTVVASLTAVWIVPIDALRSMAVGAMMVVAVSVLVSTTLLPSLMSTIGARRLSRRFRAQRRPGLFANFSWQRWTKAVVEHPVAAVVLVGGVLLVLCVPALRMRTNTDTLLQLSSKNETRIGFTEAQKEEGPGTLGPVVVTLHATGPTSQPRLHHWTVVLRRLAGEIHGVQEVGAIHIARDHVNSTFIVLPSDNPESRDAEHIVKSLRKSAPKILAGKSVTAAVGGAPASILDQAQTVASSMWKILAVLLATAFVILMFVFRSLLLPLKAIVMNLLSVGVAYGVLVTVFQWGWFDSLFHYHAPGGIYILVPPLVLAIVFGLSMDYEVFLLARIREHWLRTGDSTQAVADGLAASAGTISSAALILVCVFAVFVGTGLPIIKELGLGAAVAIGVDATLIRLILVPATMELLGRWNWWLPRPLELLVSMASATPIATADTREEDRSLTPPVPLLQDAHARRR